MNHSHRRLLHGLFAHPIATNLHLRDVENILRELGAEVSHSGHGRFTGTLAGEHISLHGGNHGLSKDEVAQVRSAIDAAGIAPVDFQV